MENESKVINASINLQPIGRVSLNLKIKNLSCLKFIKVDAHQDDSKSLDQLNFLAKLNAEFDSRAKN